MMRGLKVATRIECLFSRIANLSLSIWDDSER